jgi:hypothetical protein
MNDAVGATLKELLTPAVRDELLDDPRRLAELVRERLGTDRRREASFLNTVMQEGVPKRLLGMPAGSLSTTMIANYAKKVSEDTGLKEDVARSAIEAWSVGLGLTAGVEKPRPDSVSKPQLEQKVIAPEGDKHRFVGEGPVIKHREILSAGPVKEIRLIGILMAFSGAAALLFSELFFGGYALLSRALPIFVVAAANIYAGLALASLGHWPPAVGGSGVTGFGDATTPRQIRKVAIAVSALDAVILCPLMIFAFQAIGGNTPFQPLEILLVISIFIGAVLFPVTTLRLYRWNASTPVAALPNLLDPTAIVLLVRGLFGLWWFVMLALFWRDFEAPFFRFIGSWQLSQLPLHLVMLFMSIAIFFNSTRLAPRAVIAAVCSVSAILYAGELWVSPKTGWEWNMLSEIGMLANVVVLGLLLFSYMRDRNTVAPAA